MFAKTLKTMTNPATGNEFKVVAEMDDLEAGLRFWADTSDTSKTKLWYRLRLVGKDGADVVPFNFAEHMADRFPDIKWAGQSHGHASVLGVIAINIPFQHQGKVLDEVRGNMGGALFDLLHELFRPFHWLVSREEFATFFAETAELALYGAPFPDDAPKAVVIEFGSAKKKLIDGKEVPVADELVEDADMLEDVPEDDEGDSEESLL